MSKNKKDNTTGVDSMPSSVTELEPLVKEFVEKYTTIEHEIELLNQDKKELVEEWSEKLDMKTLKAAMRVMAVKEKVSHKDTFDVLLEVLEKI